MAASEFQVLPHLLRRPRCTPSRCKPIMQKKTSERHGEGDDRCLPKLLVGRMSMPERCRDRFGPKCKQGEHGIGGSWQDGALSGHQPVRREHPRIGRCHGRPTCAQTLRLRQDHASRQIMRNRFRQDHASGNSCAIVGTRSLLYHSNGRLKWIIDSPSR